MSDAVLELENVQRVYGKDSRRPLMVLDGADLTIGRGEVVALVAPSGAGKSTLLHLAGLLEHPDDGFVRIAGTDCNGLSDDRRTGLRRDAIGFVYQFHHLLPELTALENVSLPRLIAGHPARTADEKAEQILETMGLSGRLSHRPSELSGGEQQRVAIARAIANEPDLLLADEPTGNLDPSTSERVFAALMDIVRSTGLSALMATHNHELARQMDRIVTIADGKIQPLEI